MSAITQPATPLALVLAAGEGTRMQSATPKVLHKVAGLSLIGHAMMTAQGAGIHRIGVIIGPGRADVGAEATRVLPSAQLFTQNERRGTAHAVLQAEEMMKEGASALVILFGDTPLVQPESLKSLLAALDEPGVGVAVMGFEAQNPKGYGRLLMEGAALLAIREEKDASAEERAITLCNGGVMALKGDIALPLLKAITNENAQGEFYLTDCVGLARREGHAARVVLVEEAEAQGVNDRTQLAACESVMQQRLRLSHMRAGVTLQAPETVFFAHDTKIARDVTVEPHCVFGPGVRIDEGAVIHAFSHLEGAEVGPGASIGPFARLRPGAKLGEKARIGNFVEVKNAEFGPGAKANHLSYIGDATVGAGANIGAGTITCNYDGFRKFKTEIGAGAFIGSNSALVAPVSVGAGAYIGSGSVITADVAQNALAIARGQQVVKADWAIGFRARPENAKKGGG